MLRNNKEVNSSRRYNVLNLYKPNRRYKIHKTKIDIPERRSSKSTVIVEDLNSPLSITDGTSRQKRDDLKNIIKQLDLIDIHKYFIQQQQNTCSSQVHIKHSSR